MVTDREPADGTRVEPAIWRVAAILVLGTFMASVDATIVTVGIDTIGAEFDASVAEIQWVTTGYLLAVVAAVPASGWLVDRFGGRTVWLAAVGTFLAGSLLCAVSWSLASLVAFRVLQGLGGGLLPPVGQGLLARVAGAARIGRVLSVVGVVPLVAPVLGPMAGGGILAVADWPWLFYVNLPIGLAAMALAVRHVPRVDADGAAGRFDLRGAALLSPGLAVLVFGLTELTRDTALAAAAITIGIVMLACFTVHGLRASGTVLVDPHLFTRPPVAAAALTQLMLGVSVFGTMFLLPLYLQDGRAMTAWQAGLLLAPQGLGAALGSLPVRRLIDTVSARTLVLTGVLLVALGTVAFTQLGGISDTLLVLSLLLRGVGASMIGAPVLSLVYRNVGQQWLPQAAGALNLTSKVGGAVGTALVAVVLRARLATHAGDVTAAYAQTFWWVLGSCLLAALAAARLPGNSDTNRSSDTASEAGR